MTAHEPDMFLCAEDRETLAAIRARLDEAREEVARGEWVTDDPLDEDDWRPRHDRDGGHWSLNGNWWNCNDSTNEGPESVWAINQAFGPLTFCDCPC